MLFVLSSKENNLQITSSCLYVVFVKRIHKIKVQNIIQTGNLPSFVWTQKNKHNIPVTVLCISHAIQSLFLFIISKTFCKIERNLILDTF